MCPQRPSSLHTHTSSRRFRPDAYVHSINVELERPGSAIAAVQNALVTFAQRDDLSSAEGCMGLNAISEFGQRDAGVTRITPNAAREAFPGDGPCTEVRW
jgi:hypothetical protein